jgi:hypothetical protein
MVTSNPRLLKRLKKARAELLKTHLVNDGVVKECLSRLDNEIAAVSCLPAEKVGRPLTAQAFIMGHEARRLKKSGLTWEQVGEKLDKRFGKQLPEERDGGRDWKLWAFNLAQRAQEVDAPSEIKINVVPSPPDDRLLH